MALDGSARSAEIVPAAAALAAACAARVTLLRVVPNVPLAAALDPTFPLVSATMVPDVEATRRLEADVMREMSETAARLRDRAGLRVAAAVTVADHSAAAILDFARAQGVDAIAMSTHGRGASRLLLGSVADKVLRSADVPVLLRRATGAGGERALITSDDVAGELVAIGGAPSAG